MEQMNDLKALLKHLTQVAQLLQQTLDEEYMADGELTSLAEQKINKEAMEGSAMLR